MERISRQVQQMGVSQRPALMWSVSMVLFFFGCGLAIWYVTQYVEQDDSNSSQITMNPKYYIYGLDETYKWLANTSRSSVWWRTTEGMDGVVLEAVFLMEKLCICVKYWWFCLLFMLALTIWPMKEVINNCWGGGGFWAVVWATYFLIHRSNHAWLFTWRRRATAPWNIMRTRPWQV